MAPPLSSTKLMPVQNPNLRHTVALQMENYKARLAQNMKRERLRHGQKPSDVAYKLGIDKRTYERWEEAETSPQPSNLKALADEWMTTVDALRPDLQAEAEQLNRIEAKLDRLLQAADLPTDFETVTAELEQTIVDADQPAGSSESHNGEPPRASEK